MHLAYLFERFPTFTQTFCVREIEGLRKIGVKPPLYSIRSIDEEPSPGPGGDLESEVTYFPHDIVQDAVGRSDEPALRRLRRQYLVLRERPQKQTDFRRVYEAIWLGPLLESAGVRHVHTHFAGIGARAAYHLERLFGISFSFTAHANDIFRKEARLPLQLADLVRRAKFIVTVSDFSRTLLAERFPDRADDIHLVYNGIAPERFVERLSPSQPPMITSVGRYIEKKGFEDLITACSLLRGRDFRCQIIGYGPLEEELNRRIAHLGLSDRVVLTGPKPEEEVEQALRTSSVFALPCVQASDGGMDNLPTVIMEAMAVGLPVVSTRVAGVPEMVEQGVTGLLVPERSPEALAEAIGKLLDDQALAARMGGAGREYARGRFSLEVTTQRLRDLFVEHDVV